MINVEEDSLQINSWMNDVNKSQQKFQVYLEYKDFKPVKTDWINGAGIEKIGL
jgi:hypothetical protein